MVQLTPELVVLIAAAIGFLVTAGLKDLSAWLGQDFSSLASAITGALVTIAVASANSLLALVPPQFQQITAVVMTLIVTVLAAYGIHGFTKSLRPS